MTCILKNCAHGSLGACKTFARSGLGECGAEYALELASRNDGFLVRSTSNPTIAALKAAGKITITKTADERYVLARVVKLPSQPYHRTPMRALKQERILSRAAEIGRGINLNEETFA